MRIFDWIRKKWNDRKRKQNTVEVFHIQFDMVPDRKQITKKREHYKGGIEVFISTHCLFSTIFVTEKSQIYSHYVIWAIENNMPIKTKNRFFEEFTHHCRKHNIVTVRRNGIYCCKGVGIIS